MSIQTRLVLALSALVLALVLGIVLLFQWHFDRGLLDYVNAQQQRQMQAVSAELAVRWRDDPGWLALQDDPRRFHRLLQRVAQGGGPQRDDASPGDALPPQEPPPGRRPPPVMLLDAAHHVLLGPPGGPGPQAVEAAVTVDGRVVGYVATPRSSRLQQDLDRQFRRAQLRTLWLVGAGAWLLAVIVAVLLSRYFSRPLRQLSRAAHRLTQQQYDIDVDSRRRDEFGALARDIGELSRTLAQNATARQRWFADVSHELRTPLAVLSGEIDAMLDGVRSLDRARIVSLQQEVLHLQRLVDDLYVLARADLGALHYRKHAFDLAALLRERVDAAQPGLVQAGLHIDMQVPERLDLVGDEDRLQQLIDNLLANSCRYTAPGGTVRVALTAQGRHAEIVVEDSAPGVPEAALPKLFDHLFRVDAARSRAAGGAGLGLAIGKRIVEAHGGSITATHGMLGGLRITVRLPLDGGVAP
jgi:two-component system sensor histidine kinase BaeS